MQFHVECDKQNAERVWDFQSSSAVGIVNYL